METKTVKKYFDAADFVEIQQFLMGQHRKGWKLKAHNKKQFTFEKCKPEEYVYQLDLNDEKKDEEEYLQMFRDCGWEYILKSRDWYYFRKKKSDNESENLIFSDNVSKIEMYKNIINKKNTEFIPLYLLVLGWNYILYFTDFLKFNSVFYYASLIIGSILMLFIAFKFGVFIANINKLNKMIKTHQNPIAEFESRK